MRFSCLQLPQSTAPYPPLTHPHTCSHFCCVCCLQDGGLPSQSQGIAEDLVQDINRHAEVVLAGVDALARAAAADRVSWKGCCGAGKGRVG